MENGYITYNNAKQLVADVRNIEKSLLAELEEENTSYNTSKQNLLNQKNAQVSEAENRKQAAANSLQSNVNDIVGASKRIVSEIAGMDARLASVDGNYLRERQKRAKALANARKQEYFNGGDLYQNLCALEKEYISLYGKYINNPMPGSLGALSMLLSGQRKNDYDDLIILRNTATVLQFNIENMFPNQISQQLEQTNNDIANEIGRIQNNYAAKLEELNAQHNMVVEQIGNKAYIEVNNFISDEVIDRAAQLYDSFKNDMYNVKTKELVDKNVFTVQYEHFNIANEFKMREMYAAVQNKFKKILWNSNNNHIQLPIISEIGSYPAYYLTYDNRNDINEFVDSYIFSYLSQVEVGKLRISIADCENKGMSAETYLDMKSKIPDLFGGQIITNEYDLSERLRELNSKMQMIMQEKLRTEYSDIYDYNRQKNDDSIKIELVVLFDFPNGISENDMSIVQNLLQSGAKCGIYVFITQSKMNMDNFSEKYRENIQTIKKMCQEIVSSAEKITLNGWIFSWNNINKNEFKKFISKYIMQYERLSGNSSIFNNLISQLVESKDDVTLKSDIHMVKMIETEHDRLRQGISVPLDIKYPSYIVAGDMHYPADIFEEAYGYNEISNQLNDGNGQIKLPYILNTKEQLNLYIESNEESIFQAQKFVHNIIWNFFLYVPATKLNVSVFDSERKGQSINPFLEFRKKSPEIFDNDIHTNTEEIYERLKKFNEQIDDCIQMKLGNNYKTIIDYNERNSARAVELNLLVINDFPSGFDSRSIGLLSNIIKNGNKCGIYTIINHNTDIEFSGYDNNENIIETIKENSAYIEAKEGSIYLAPFDLLIDGLVEFSLEEIDKFVDGYIESVEKIKNKPLLFDDILGDDLFSKKTKNSLDIPIGIGDEDKVVQISFGKGSSHHALIAGATGSGKSTLLHTLITSAMLNYSPDELNLYLMDFKSGTEFKIYDSTSYRLPHIKLLALDAMQEFGESILENLISELARRSELFKKAQEEVGTQISNISDYVEKTNKPMPRILVVMDEFQILYNDSSNRKVAHNCAQLTKRIVTEGRSYGIHLLMATQSTRIIGDLSLDSGTIEQMRIRVGLKCGEYDARYLFKDNETKALELMKGPRGTAVLNQEYVEQDVIGFRVAYCDEDTQKTKLEMIADRFKDSEYTLQSFEGNATNDLLDIYDKKEKSGEQCSGKNIEVEIGDLIKVAPPLSITFDRKKKHNILICGSSEKMADNLFNMFALSILKCRTADFYCIDGEMIVGDEDLLTYYNQYKRFGDTFKLAKMPKNIIEYINEIYDIYSNKKKGHDGRTVFVGIRKFQIIELIKQMMKDELIDESEYFDEGESSILTDDIFSRDKPFDFGTGDMPSDVKDKDIPSDVKDKDVQSILSSIDNTPSLKSIGVSEKLLKLLNDGSTYGIYFIMSCNEFQSIKDNMLYSSNLLSKFTERFVFSLSDMDAESLIEGISVASLSDNTVYFSDMVKKTYQVKPYVFPDAERLGKYLDSKIG